MSQSRCQLICGLLSLLLAAGYVSASSFQFKNTCVAHVNDEINEIDSDQSLTMNPMPAYVCCPGYDGPIDNCQPVCIKGCEANSYCKLPGVCECLEGYEKDEGGDCKSTKHLHLCTKNVEVTYTTEEPFPSKDLVDELKILDIIIHPINVTKTKLELRQVCCYGYERVNDTAPCLPKADPNLCTEEVQVEVEATDNMDWKQLELDLLKNNITLPTPFPSFFKTEIRHVCCEGYEKHAEHGHCQPKCLEACDEKSFCSKPNVCDCIEGYERSLHGSCHPQCIPSCGANSYCRVGNVCECLEGYHIATPNGSCVSKTDIVAPEDISHLCTKNVEVEYTVNETLPLNCLGDLFEELIKLNISIEEFPVTKIRMETKQVCCDGYERINDEAPCLPKDPNLCTKKVQVEIGCTESPIWDELKIEFEYFNLSLPTDLPPTTRTEIQMVCCDGYETKTGKTHCQAVCNPKCPANSYCMKPNMCVCLENYHMGASGLCVKESNDIKAVDPHMCSKNVEVTYVDEQSTPLENYGSLSNILKLLSIQGKPQNVNKTRMEVQYFCCPGYKQQTKGGLCLPDCSKGCGDHCSCAKPEVCECEANFEHNNIFSNMGSCGPHSYCQCIDGYAKGKSGFCEPVCAAGCPAYSGCIKPGQCQCNEGYTNTSSIDNVGCQPICLGIPTHSRCIRPDEWECDSGYIKLPSNDGLGFNCEPHCQQSCSTYGKCVAPNKCQCLEGYEDAFFEIGENAYFECIVIEETTVEDESTMKPETTEDMNDTFSSVDYKFSYRTA